MRHIVAVLVVLMLVVSASRSPEVYGQTSCTFVGGFASLRDLVGPEGVGACLEDEHLNAENGNVEQRTARGLLVWRKIDNFTAFTDGGTTWINGPNGLESRPNDERLAWELEPAVEQAAPPTPRPLPTFPPPELASHGPSSSPVPVGGLPPAPSAANSGARGAATGAASSSVATTANATGPTAARTSASTTARAGVPPAPGAPGTTANTVAAATTPTATPTKTPTPKPSVSVRFTESPDDVDTGSDAHFAVETSAKKGSCLLEIEYRNSSDTTIGGTEIDDGKCEWRFTVPTTARTGKATAKVTVSASTGSATADNSFTVKKGDFAYAGNLDVEIETDDLPDSVDLGQELKIDIDTNLKRRGTCELVFTWPKLGPVSAESKMPDDKGKCSWTVKAPTDMPTKSTASMVITVRKDNNTVRTLTKELKVGGK
jgi:hypothetical protein